MHFTDTGYDGSKFSDFYVEPLGSVGPGWFIMGRNKEKYGVDPRTGKGRYVSLCGYRKRGKARNYNGEVRHGWLRKKDALAALASLHEARD